MRLSIVGCGYVGLVTGSGLTEKNHEVYCVDVLKEKVDLINSGKTPFYEYGLEDLLKNNLGKKLLATQDIKDAILNTEGTFICVGTPSHRNGAVDLRYIEKASQDIGKVLKEKKDRHTVIVKSTVPPTTTEQTVIPILEKYSEKYYPEELGAGMNPEFLKEGVALQDFRNPDRIVLGANDKETSDFLEGIYKEFTAPKLKTSIKTAEMIKYASNAFLATKISFINEIGNVCKELGIDVYDVAKGMGMDSRISPHFLKAGPGFGGSCFPKDVKGLIHTAKETLYEPILLQSVLKVNRKQPKRVVQLTEKKLGYLKGKKIGVLGLAFKENTDDMRESPTISIINALLKEGAIVEAYDPKAMENAKAIFNDRIKYSDSGSELLKNNRNILILTPWGEFKSLDYKGKTVIDTRKIIDDITCVDYEGLCW